MTVVFHNFLFACIQIKIEFLMFLNIVLITLKYNLHSAQFLIYIKSHYNNKSLKAPQYSDRKQKNAQNT